VRDQTKIRLRVLAQPLVRLLLALRVPPNAVTIAGLALSIAVGLLLGQGRFFAAGIVLLLAGLSDTVDGELARQSNRPSSRGAFLDSTLDRISEFAVFFGLFWFLRRSPGTAALVFATLFASFAVSYVRARAEGIGIDCKIGIFERPVRFLFLVLGIFFNRYLSYALWIILAGAAFTTVQRILAVLQMKKD
jgi:CDP-diacylglycerol--glycerol-3-phosphate 3-phosphatidyltransferase